MKRLSQDVPLQETTSDTSLSQPGAIDQHWASAARKKRAALDLEIGGEPTTTPHGGPAMLALSDNGTSAATES